MNRKLAVLKAAVICVLSNISMPGHSQAQTSTGSTYNPLTNGKRITYQVFSIYGYWHDAQMLLDIVARKPSANSPQSVAFSSSRCPSYFGDGALYQKFQYAGAGAPSTIIPNQTLQDGGGISPSGVRYIGEAINNLGEVQTPFIAEITFNPVTGEVIEGSSLVQTSCNDTTIIAQNYLWKYATIGYYANWGAFNDTWRTALRENDGQVYNYVFQNNVGAVNFWYGFLINQTTGALVTPSQKPTVTSCPDSSIKPADPSTYNMCGYEFYAISSQ